MYLIARPRLGPGTLPLCDIAISAHPQHQIVAVIIVIAIIIANADLEGTIIDTDIRPGG